MANSRRMTLYSRTVDVSRARLKIVDTSLRFPLAGLAVLVLSMATPNAGLAAAAGAQGPDERECRGGFPRTACVITRGSHSGFQIGMSKGPALAVLCGRVSDGRAWQAFFGDRDTFGIPRGRAACQRAATETADRWEFKERGGVMEMLADRRVTLLFSGGVLRTITVAITGMDP